MYHSVESNRWEEVGDQDFALSMAIFVREGQYKSKNWVPFKPLRTQIRSDCLINVGTCRKFKLRDEYFVKQRRAVRKAHLQAVLLEALTCGCIMCMRNWIMNGKGLNKVSIIYWHNDSWGHWKLDNIDIGGCAHSIGCGGCQDLRVSDVRSVTGHWQRWFPRFTHSYYHWPW